MLFLNDGGSSRRAWQPGAGADGAVWLDLMDPTEAELEAAGQMTGLRVPSRDNIAEIESSSRVFTENGAMYFSMPYSYLGEDGRAHVTPVGFVLSDTILLSLRYRKLPAIDSYAERMGQHGAAGSAAVFVGLLEAIVDRLADVLERVAADLNRLSQQTFASEDQSAHRRTIRRADRELRMVLTEVGRCGDSLGNLRDSVLGIGRIVGYSQQACAGWSPELVTRLATLRSDVTSLNDYDQQLNSKVSFLLDAVLGFINIEQNNGVKVLTVVSVAGIPPTFVVGLYGMNFKNMPEYGWAWGYEFGWLMIIISVIIPLVWFRIKGWL